MTSSTLSSLQQLQSAPLISAIAQAGVLVECSVKQSQFLQQQRYRLKSQLHKIKALQKPNLLTHSCQITRNSGCVSAESLQPTSVKYKSNISVKVNLKALTTSCLATNQEFLSQTIQLVSAICQNLNWLYQSFIKSAGTPTATLNAQNLRENSYELLLQRQRHFWETFISEPVQTLLECSSITFFNQTKFNPDGKNHPKDTLRLFVRYRKLNRRGSAAFCVKRIFSRKRVNAFAEWRGRLSTM